MNGNAIDWQEYFETLAARMDFDPKKIRVKIEAEDDGEQTFAQIFFEEPNGVLEIHLYPLFLRQTAHSQRETAVHELCHAIVRPLSIQAASVEKALGKRGWAAFEAAWEEWEDGVVQHMARVIADSVPPPKSN